MQSTPKPRLLELQRIMSKMTLEMCCYILQPEFGLQWRDVARAVRNARLPMTPSNIARVVCKRVAKNLPVEEVNDIISSLSLLLVATENRVWHVIKLLEPLTEDPVEPAELQERMLQVLRSSRIGRSNMGLQVHVDQLDNLVFVSVQLSPNKKSRKPLYLATPPGVPVALTSSNRAAGLLKVCVQGLGYKIFEDANLYGRDIRSLLRIHAGWDENVDHLNEISEYSPVPVLTKSGIDYTNKVYDEQYLETILGPDPPLLTDLCIKTSCMFFDPQILNKKMNVLIKLKSVDVAKTLKSWVVKGALAPDSDFFQIYKMKSNKIYCNDEV